MAGSGELGSGLVCVLSEVFQVSVEKNFLKGFILILSPEIP